MTLSSFSQGEPLRRIVIFRALNLGDILCLVPALRMLRQAAPHAHVAFIGLSNVQDCIARFPHYIDEFIDFPGDSWLPERKPRVAEAGSFYQSMQEREFDLAIQMHGSGTHSNGIVRRLGARRWAGFVPDKQQQTAQRLLWPDHQPEIIRYVSLLQHMGLALNEDVSLELPLTRTDHRKAEVLAACLGISLHHTVILHPGARLASRRWPAERFVELGRQLVGHGWEVAITGSASECDLTATVTEHIGAGAIDCGGLTDLGMLASFLKQARLLVCNDTGVSHVAAAVRAPTVVIASGSDVQRWAPLDSELHTVLYHDMPCRPCAWDVCPVPGHPCATRITVDDVMSAVQAKLKKEQTDGLATLF